MSFVNEIISDEDRRKFSVAAIKRPPLYSEPIDTRYWTMDRQRHAFLIWTRGGNMEDQTLEQFALVVDGTVVYVRLDHEADGAFSSHVNSRWHLRGIDIPPELEPRRQDVLALLRDALTEYKVGGLPVRVNSHAASFDF